MKNKINILRLLGILFSIIVIALFLESAIIAAMEGWSNPR